MTAAVRWVQLSPDKRDEKLAGAAEETDTGRAASAGAGGGPPGTRADPALLTALAALAARTRELAEAVVLSEAAPAELDRRQPRSRTWPRGSTHGAGQGPSGPRPVQRMAANRIAR